jgi:hypothetical protein
VTYATTLIEPTKGALRIKDAAMDSDQNVAASAWLRPATEKLWLSLWSQLYPIPFMPKSVSTEKCCSCWRPWFSHIPHSLSVICHARYLLSAICYLLLAIGYWLLAMRFAMLLFAFALMRSLIPGKIM